MNMLRGPLFCFIFRLLVQHSWHKHNRWLKGRHNRDIWMSKWYREFGNCGLLLTALGLTALLADGKKTCECVRPGVVYFMGGTTVNHKLDIKGENLCPLIPPGQQLRLNWIEATCPPATPPFSLDKRIDEGHGADGGPESQLTQNMLIVCPIYIKQRHLQAHSWYMTYMRVRNMLYIIY